MHHKGQIRSEKQLRKYLKQIKKLAAMLPPMEGHDHSLNMQTLLFQHGPAAVQGYIGMVDEVIYTYEQSLKNKTMLVTILNDNTDIAGTLYAKDQVIDLPILHAKVAFATGKATPVNPDDQYTPEAVAETVHNAETENATVQNPSPNGQS
jgi:hypothetical protein